MNPHDRLRCFHASYDLAIAVVKSTERWPKREMFGLSAQARRAATSIPINIAEGAAKRGRNELVRYIACDLDFMPPGEVAQLEARRKESVRQVWKLYRVTQAGKGRPSAPPTAK